MPKLHPEALTPAAFAPFGDVLDATGDFRLINDGMCQRHHDRARLDFAAEIDANNRPGLSIFNATPRQLPYTFDLIERHPEGSQAFIPMTQHPFLVIVATSPNDTPRAFLTNGAQAINLHRGTMARRADPAARPRPVRGGGPHRHIGQPRGIPLPQALGGFSGLTSAQTPV